MNDRAVLRPTANPVTARGFTRAIVGITLCVQWVMAASLGVAQDFSRPVSCDTCISHQYYVDHGQRTDWNCGSSTYADHRGTDYSLRNGNRAIDTGYDILAMADGVVVHSEDGYYDRCTQCGGASCGLSFGNGFANRVVVDHGPYRVIYAHMRRGSVRVAPGDRVACGQAIGQIGSSGCSTGAHLHVEPSVVRSGRRVVVDPHAGPCSSTQNSLWAEQGAWRALPGQRCDDMPPTPSCPADTFADWTCSEGGSARRRCIEGVDTLEDCEWGCSAVPTGDDICDMPPDADGDGLPADVDCDDGDPLRHPGATEVCGDGIDQDCDGTDEPCPDADGTPPGAAPPGLGADAEIDAGVHGPSGSDPSMAGNVSPMTGEGTGASAPPVSSPGDHRGGCSAVSDRGTAGSVWQPLLFGLLAASTWIRRRRRLPAL